MADLTLRGRIIVDVSRHLCDLTGHSRDELLQPGMLYRLFGTHDLDLLATPGTYQMQMTHAAGRAVPVIVSVSARKGRFLIDIDALQ